MTASELVYTAVEASLYICGVNRVCCVNKINGLIGYERPPHPRHSRTPGAAGGGSRALRRRHRQPREGRVPLHRPLACRGDAQGRTRQGDVLQVRMVSGEEPDGKIAQSNEEAIVLPGLPRSLEPGGCWLLHLNDAMYEHQAFIHSGENAARRGGRWYVATITPAPVVAGVVEASFFGQTPFPLP